MTVCLCPWSAAFPRRCSPALQRPGDDIEMSGLGVLGRTGRARSGCHSTVEERPHGRHRRFSRLEPRTTATRSALGEYDRALFASSRYTACLPNSGFVADPIEDVSEVERLGEHVLGRDPRLLVLVNHCLGVGRLAAEHILDLEFGITVGPFERLSGN